MAVEGGALDPGALEQVASASASCSHARRRGRAAPRGGDAPLLLLGSGIALSRYVSHKRVRERRPAASRARLPRPPRRSRWTASDGSREGAEGAVDGKGDRLAARAARPPHGSDRGPPSRRGSPRAGDRRAARRRARGRRRRSSPGAPRPARGSRSGAGGWRPRGPRRGRRGSRAARSGHWPRGSRRTRPGWASASVAPGVAASASRAPTQSEEAAAAAISSHHSKPGSRPDSAAVRAAQSSSWSSTESKRSAWFSACDSRQRRAWRSSATADRRVGGQRRAAARGRSRSARAGSRRRRRAGAWSVVVGVLGGGVEGDFEGSVQAQAVGERIVARALGDAVEIVEHQLVGDEAAGQLGAMLGGGEDGERGEALGVGALVAVGGERVGAEQRVGDRLGAGEEAALGGPGGREDPEPVAAGGGGEEADRSGTGERCVGGRRARLASAVIRARGSARRIGWIRVGAAAKS